MIIARTPFRASFAGGGTDLPDFYRREAGALGGKVLGAGGSGFLLFFVERQNQERVRQRPANLRELSFRLEPQGSKIIYVGG